jgi:uridine kinase
MYRGEEDVIIVCGLYLLAEEEKRKKRKLSFIKLS